MNDYYFYELDTNSLIPGDWEWYVANYGQHHEIRDGRPGWRSSLEGLDLRVYDIPRQIQPFTLNCTAFWSQNAMRYRDLRLPAPPGVIEGAATCAKRDFVEKIGFDVARRNCITGNILMSDGSAAESWLPLIPRNELKVDISQWDDLSAYAAQLSDHELYASGRFILILRGDVFSRVKDFDPKGCRIVHWSSSTRKFTVLRKSKPPPAIGAREQKKAESDPFIRQVMDTWKAAAKGKRGDEAAEAIRNGTRKMKSERPKGS